LFYLYLEGERPPAAGMRKRQNKHGEKYVENSTSDEQYTVLGPVHTYFLNIKVKSIEAKIRVTGLTFGLSPVHRAQTEYQFVPGKNPPLSGTI
jgi:hypothetical protein